MKNHNQVCFSQNKRQSRNLINRHIFDLIRKNNGNVEIITMPSIHAVHEKELYSKIYTRFYKTRENINLTLVDRSRNILEQAFDEIFWNTKLPNLFILGAKNGFNSIERLSCDIFDTSRFIFNNKRKVAIWYDICSGPTESNLYKLKKSISSLPVGSIFFITFLTDGIRENWGSQLDKNSLNLISDINNLIINNNCNIKTLNNFPYNYNHKINNKTRRVAVFGFLKTDIKELTESPKTHKMVYLMKNKKTAEDYAKLSKKFTNKQISVFWRMPLNKIAGFAAAAKRKGLV